MRVVLGISSECAQDLQKCRNVLLGSSSGQQSELNLPCPGMFQERKQSNFFQVTLTKIFPKFLYSCGTL